MNKGKCDAWGELLLAIIKMARDLTDDEAEYIKAKFSIEFGKLKLNELENKKEEDKQ